MPGKHGDFYSSEYQDADIKDHPWEENRGMGGSYGFNRAENLEDYQSSEELVEELIDVVSRGGNFLLNIGPTADGRIPVIQQERLADIGEWFEINGEAIYGTRKYEQIEAEDTASAISSTLTNEYYYTSKEKDLYVLCIEYPEVQLIINELPNTKGINVTLLGYSKDIDWTVKGDQCIISPPQMYPSQFPCKYAFVFKIEGVLSN